MISKVSFWQLFRLIFVLFSLYLLGDAFYRWDGFSYYASFSEFLPGVALVSILWSIVALITTIFIWLLLKPLEWFCYRISWKINAGNLLIFLCFFVLTGTIIWVRKGLLFGSVLTLQQKLAVLLSVIFIASFLTWILRGRLKIFLERITPLVWLFGVIVILSVPLVVYNTWIKDTELKESSRISISGKSRPNIILVTFDALAVRDMSLYGYKRETTPFISKWAKNASVFTNAKAEDGYTTPTTASLMTGQRLWTHQTYHQRSAIPRGNTENIALLLKNNGYYAMAYVENLNASPVGLNIFKSFNYYKSFIPEEQHFLAKFHSLLYHLFFGKIKLYDWILLEDFGPTALFEELIYYPIYYPIYQKDIWESKKTIQKNASTILDEFILDIDNNNIPEPFFVWMHVMPPHEPYLPPEPFMGMFDSSSELRTLDGQFQYRRMASENIQKFGQFTRDDLKLLDTYRARYDENILYADKEFEDFINQLLKRNTLNNTVVVLSADHGESFEHNQLGHGEILYEQVMSIPLIIKYPNQTEGRIIDDIIEQIDIPATILDIADISLPLWMEGRSLVPLMYNKKLLPKPAFSMHLEANRRRGHQIEKGVFVVWEGDFKLIHDLEKEESLLFNLKKDPEEQDNLINKESEVGRHLLELIQDNLEKANEKILKGW